jgi:hypothetical protein
MEIKIVCACGTKFKFEVEPINNRMPAPVNCPGCGADATGQANEIIQSTLAPPPAQPAPPPGPPVPIGLRVHQASAPPAVAPAGADAAAVPPPSRPPALRPVQTARKPEPKNALVKALTAVLLLAIIGFGAWRFGYKWFKRLNFIAQVASAVGEASVNSSESEGAKNLWYEDGAVLFIKHTNQLEVAEACKEYWKTKLHKNLTVINSPQESENPGEYELMSPYNGYVRIIGAFEWPVPEHEGLAQHLSHQFGTLVFEWRSEHVADTYHFGVYDQGTRKFHAQMDVKITQDNADEIVTTEGNTFAIANGYKPGPEGFKEFNVLDADKITQRLGMKLWDEPEGTPIRAGVNR